MIRYAMGTGLRLGGGDAFVRLAAVAEKCPLGLVSGCEQLRGVLSRLPSAVVPGFLPAWQNRWRDAPGKFNKNSSL
jgi:hypothetical protein